MKIVVRGKKSEILGGPAEGSWAIRTWPNTEIGTKH